jgi:hypothetical protein
MRHRGGTLADAPTKRASPSDPAAAKRKKKKRKRRSEPAVSTETAAPPAKPASRFGGKIWFVLLGVALLEVWLFGRRGHVEVCVGKQGVHDFALLGQTRTDENSRRFPTCEKRQNIGIASKYDAAVEDATLHACRRANILFGKDAILLCAVKEDGWEHRVTAEQCPPWHDHYYQRLFWFLSKKE